MSMNLIPQRSSIRAFMAVLAILAFVVPWARSASAAQYEVGEYTNVNETCNNITDSLQIAGFGLTAAGLVSPDPLTKPIAALGLTTAIIGFAADGLCENADEGIKALFSEAYEEARSKGVFPNDPNNPVHYWVGGIMIQDFPQTQDSEGRLIGDGWGALISDGVDGSEPHYVYGSIWEAYKRAVYDESVLGGGIFPGYPTSFQHQWNRVVIQDFADGSWGMSAIIGGDQQTAWLVAGNHLEAYLEYDGSNTLGNPLGPVERNEDGDYQQRFEDGIIFELAGETWVEYYDESDTPEEFPPVGYEGPADSVIEPSYPEDISPSDQAPTDSDVVCSESEGIQISSPLTVSPDNPDTSTTVTFSVTLTNFGCDTWAPNILAIAGRYTLDGNETILDPYQDYDFQLGPGESRDITQQFTLDIAAEWYFYMAYEWTNGHWNEIYDASGDSPRVYVSVADAGSVEYTEPDDEGAESSNDGGEDFDVSQFESGCTYSWVPDSGGWVNTACDDWDVAVISGDPMHEPRMDGCNYIFDGVLFWPRVDFECN